MKKDNLTYPNMHDEAIHYLKYLSDIKYQERVWRDFDFPKTVVPFGDIIHFIFDDTHLSDDADDCIGWFLRDANEAAHIRAVAKALDIVIDKYYEENLTDAERITKPEWQQVLTTAKAALDVLSAPDAPDEGPASA